MSDTPVFTVSKADSIGREPTAGAVLNITADLPRTDTAHETEAWRAFAKDRYEAEAQRVVAALSALPGGTLDAVLIFLLQQRASLLRVPHRSSSAKETS